MITTQLQQRTMMMRLDSRSPAVVSFVFITGGRERVNSVYILIAITIIIKIIMIIMIITIIKIIMIIMIIIIIKIIMIIIKIIIVIIIIIIIIIIYNDNNTHCLSFLQQLLPLPARCSQ